MYSGSIARQEERKCLLSVYLRKNNESTRIKITCFVLLAISYIVQSLNSPFFLPPIGPEPGRAKRESRITCMHMLRAPPFFPPSAEKPYLEVLSRFGLWRVFLNNNIQATISAFRLVKNMSINSKSVEFYQCHAKPHSICYLPQYQR